MQLLSGAAASPPSPALAGPRRRQQRCRATQSSLLDASPFVAADAVRCMVVDGKGRGMVASDELQPGALLVRCAPLLVVEGPRDTAPPLEQLVAAATDAAAADPGAAATLHWLHGGGADDDHDSEGSSAPLPPDLLALATRGRVEGVAAAASSCSSGSSSGAASSAADDAADVRGALVCNAYGEPYDDLAACAVARVAPASFAGVWPLFSMFNHSCAPNCVHWVLPGSTGSSGRMMAVRAACRVQPGAELTLSYLGLPQLRPLAARQAALESFGFSCGCQRCEAEDELPRRLQDLLEEADGRARSAFAPRIHEALTTAATAAAAAGGAAAVLDSDARAVLADVRRQAGAMLSVLVKELKLVHPQRRDFVLGSAFGLLEVIADADAVLARAGDDADSTSSQEATVVSLERCLRVLAAVSPGSDLHVITAAKLVAAAGGCSSSNSSSSSSLAAAHAACASAHALRYGLLSDEQLQQLARLNRELYV